jgi:hypothetical protein
MSSRATRPNLPCKTRTAADIHISFKAAIAARIPSPEQPHIRSFSYAVHRYYSAILRTVRSALAQPGTANHRTENQKIHPQRFPPEPASRHFMNHY